MTFLFASRALEVNVQALVMPAAGCLHASVFAQGGGASPTSLARSSAAVRTAAHGDDHDQGKTTGHGDRGDGVDGIADAAGLHHDHRPLSS